MNILLENKICNFLKKLNIITASNEFAEFVTEGVVELTGANASCICIMTNFSNKIDIKHLYIPQEQKSVKKYTMWIERVSRVGIDMLTNKYEVNEIIEYLDSISKDRLIIEPLFYKDVIIGFVAAISRNKKFYSSQNVMMSLLMEGINSRVEVLELQDELERTNREKIQFLASISHEYKTPLNSIIGFSEMLKEKVVGTSAYQYAENISKSSEFLLSLIQDILDMARSEYKPMELKYQYFDPSEAIKDILYSLNDKFTSKEIELKVTLMDVDLYADMKRFKQLIYNFVSNSLKFNKQGGKISIITYVDEEDNYIFEIKDSGDGIRKKDYDKIFNFFSQVNRNKLKRQQGSGVGLALCKTITMAHGGDIGFKSRLNCGSTFWFSIPVVGKPIEDDSYYI